MDKKLKGAWMTNNPKSLLSWYPRRAVLLREGSPKATSEYTVEEFKAMGMVGIYLDEDVEDLSSMKMCTNRNEYMKNLRERGL
jgi:hypothetical protein